MALACWWSERTPPFEAPTVMPIRGGSRLFECMARGPSKAQQVGLSRARQRLRASLTRRGVAPAAALAGALASEEAVSAALVRAAVRSGLGSALGGASGALSPSVLTLTEGVLRAMFLSKIKFVAAVLLSTALAGAGVAWVTYRAEAGERPDATGPRAAAKPLVAAPRAPAGAPDSRAQDERAVADRRREEQQKRLQRAVESLRRAETKAEKREEQWLKELIEARLKVMDLREELKAGERDLNDRLPATDPTADVMLRTLLNDRDRAVQHLYEEKMKSAKDSDIVAKLAGTVKELEEKVEWRQQVLKKEAADKQKERDVGFAQLRGLRRELVAAEERLQALQRRQERERDGARSDLEEKGRRVRQLQQSLEDVASPPPAADLERKLDRVLRELAELRRALQAPGEKRPEGP